MNPLNIIRHLPNFARLLYRLYRDPRVGFPEKFYVWGGMGYFIFPFDFIPDFFIPLIGYGDDIFIVLFLFWAFIKNCPDDVVSEHVKQIEEETGSIFFSA